MFAALLFAMLLAAAPAAAPSPGASGPASPTPSPTPAKPLILPTPGATPWSTLSLGTVSLSDTADAVRAALGPPVSTNAKSDIEIWTYSFDLNHVSLVALLRHGRVIGLAADLHGAKQSKFSDPFGIQLGDGYDMLLTKRGQPTEVAGTRNVYAAGPSFDWEYQFAGGIVASISLSTKVPINGPLPTPSAGPRGHDGSSLETPIRFKVKTARQADNLEALFLAQQRCDGQGTWTPTGHSALSNGLTHSVISVYSVTCSTTQREARFYFDHTGLR